MGLVGIFLQLVLTDMLIDLLLCHKQIVIELYSARTDGKTGELK